MNKLKSCMNDMCPFFNIELYNNCDLYTKETIGCKKYLTEKPESAWEMFRQLYCERGEPFINKIRRLTGWHEQTAIADTFYVTKFFLLYSEKEAIKIMQEIENKLKR